MMFKNSFFASARLAANQFTAKHRNPLCGSRIQHILAAGQVICLKAKTQPALGAIMPENFQSSSAVGRNEFK